MASSSSTSAMLALAVVAAVLFAGAWCTPPFSFKVEKGSTEKKLALDITYSKAGDTLSEVELRQHGSEEWMPMKKTYGKVWTVECSKPLQGPFNFRFMTAKGTRRVYDEVIPTAFKIGSTYIPE